jgi:hypothetical protein
MLSALAGLVSGGGAEKLIGSLRHFDAGSISRLKTDVARGEGGKVRDQGADILGSLLGGNLPAIIAALEKFSGIGAAALKGLLSYLAPLVLSAIAAQLQGKSLNPATLGGFFNDQKANIQGALPAGLSLGSAPSAPRVEAPGMPGWMLPLAGLIVLGIAAWYFMSNQEAVPEAGEAPPAAQTPVPVPSPTPAAKALPPVKPELKVAIPTADELTRSLDGIYDSATEALTPVKDAGTAEAAAPKLSALGAKIDSVKALWDKVPDSAKEAVKKAAAERLAGFKALVEKALEIPGVGDKLKPILEGLVAKLSEFATS